MKRMFMYFALILLTFTVAACNFGGTDPDDDTDIAVQAVITLINALPETVSLNDQTAVTSARTAYDALNETQKAAVTNYNRLQAAEARIVNLLAAKAVDDLIDALPATITLANQTEVQAARAAYTALTTAQRALVTKLDTLTAAEATLANRIAADNVISLINALPATITMNDAAAIATARAAYDALTAAQQALVTNYATLTSAETTLAGLTTVQSVIDMINALPATITLADQPDILAARAAYDSLSSADQANVTNYSTLVDAETQLANLDVVTSLITLIDSLPTVITLDHQETIELARTSYDALTTAQKADITNYSDLVAAEAKLEVVLVQEMIEALPIVLTVHDIQAIQAARTAYDALTSNQQSQVTNLSKLIQTEAQLTYLVPAKEVYDLIAALSDPLTVAEIEAARTAYNALDTTAKALVENYDELLAAEMLLDALLREPLTDQIIADWQNDLAFLQDIMLELELNQQFQMTTVVDIEISDPYTGEPTTMQITMIDSFLRHTDRNIIQREMHIETDQAPMILSMNMMFVDHGDSVTVYIYIADILNTLQLLIEDDPEAADIVNSVLEGFDIQDDWARYHFEDSLANMVEFEILKLFFQEMIYLQIPELRDLDGIEDMLLEMINADKTTANIRLPLLFDTLFTFDINAVVAHIFEIDITYLSDQAIAELLVPELLFLLEEHEIELKDDGFDYDNLYLILHDNGFYDFIDALHLSPLDAEILGEYLGIPLWPLIDAYKDGTLPNTILLFALEDMLYQDIRYYIENTLWQYEYDIINDGIHSEDFYDILAILWYEDLEAFMAWAYNNQTDALILETYLGFPLIDTAEGFIEDTLTESLLDTLYGYLESELDYPEGASYTELVAFVESIDFSALVSEIELFDFNEMRDELIHGRYYAYLDSLPESEIKHILSFFMLLIEDEMEEAAAIFEYATLFEDLSRFQKFMTLDFYGSHEEMAIALSKTDENKLKANMTFSMDMFEAVTLEFLQELWLHINQLQSIDLPLVDPINCGLEEDCIDWYELKMLYDYLSDMGALDMILEYDPLTQEEYTVFMDFTHMINYLFEQSNNDDYGTLETQDIFTKFHVHVTMNKHSQSEEPAEYTDLNRVIEEAAQLILMLQIDEFIWAIEDHQEYDSEPLPEGVYTLEELVDIIRHVGIFDLTLSTIEITDTDFIFTLYYIDGTLVFDAPLSASTIRDFFDAGPPTRLELLDFIGHVEDNFTMTRLLLVFFAYEAYDIIYGGRDWDDWDGDPWYGDDAITEDYPGIGDWGQTMWWNNDGYNGFYFVYAYNSHCSECNTIFWDVEGFLYNITINQAAHPSLEAYFLMVYHARHDMTFGFPPTDQFGNTIDY